MNPTVRWLLGAKSFTESLLLGWRNLNWDGKIFPLSKERVGASRCPLLSQFSHTKGKGQMTIGWKKGKSTKIINLVPF